MKNIFLSLFFISLFFINPVNSNQKISFIDMDKVISTTNSGSSILKQLSNINNKNSIFLNKEQKKLKEKEKKLISEQAPPKKIKKTKTKTVVSLDKKLEKIDNQKPESLPLPEKTVKKIETKKETKQNPEKVVTEVKQVSEFEKKDIFDPSDIAALIDKSKTESAETNKKLDKITQDQDKEMDFGGLTLSEEDALKAQIFGCWSIPLGLPFNEDLLVRIKLQLEPDGSIIKTEILDHARMNRPGQGFYKVLAESALRAIKLCQPLRVPSTGYERWKDMQLNFDAREMLEG